MSNTIKSWPSNRDKCYYVRLGAISETTGKPKAVMLKDESGRKVELGDEAGRIKALGRLIAEREERERRDSGPLVREIIDEFIAYHRKHNSAKRTINEHIYRLAGFGKFATGGVPFANRPATSMRLKDLSAFRRSREENGSQTGDLKLWYASILACWHWASRPVEDRDPERLITENPFDGVKRPKRGDQVKKYISPYQTEQLIEFAESRIDKVHEKASRLEPRRVLALKAIARSGARPFEVAGLQWKEIDWTARVIKLDPRPKGRSKTRKGRMIAIPDEVYEQMQELRDHPENDPKWVFALKSKFRQDEPTSRQLGIWFRELKNDAIAAGIPLERDLTLYYFRHAWQTMGMQRVGVDATAAAAGNSPYIMLSTYDQTQADAVHRTSAEVNAGYKAEVEKAKAEILQKAHEEAMRELGETG